MLELRPYRAIPLSFLAIKVWINNFQPNRFKLAQTLMLTLKRLSHYHPTSVCSCTRAWREQRTYCPHIWCCQYTQGTTRPVTTVATGRSLLEHLSCFCAAQALLTVPRQRWKNCPVTPAAMNSARGWVCLLKLLVFVLDIFGPLQASH